MKRNFVFAAMLSLFVCVIAVSAQDKTSKAANFSGIWTLDVANSKLGERSNIESQTMTVTQTETTIKVEMATKRKGAGGGRPGGGFVGGGGGDTALTYNLDGKETRNDGGGATPVMLKAKFDGSQLNISQSRTFNGPQGEISIVTKDKWSLGADGKTLTVNRESSTLRGSNSTTLVFVKK